VSASDQLLAAGLSRARHCAASQASITMLLDTVERGRGNMLACRVYRSQCDTWTPPPPFAGSNDEAAGAQEQADRLLYYYPHDAPLEAQLGHVGFVEGIIDFSRSFAAEGDCDTVSLDSRRVTLAQVEPQVWMVLVGGAAVLPRWQAQRGSRSNPIPLYA
jgi:hypothetical protein